MTIIPRSNTITPSQPNTISDALPLDKVKKANVVVQANCLVPSIPTGLDVDEDIDLY